MSQPVPDPLELVFAGAGQLGVRNMDYDAMIRGDSRQFPGSAAPGRLRPRLRPAPRDGDRGGHQLFQIREFLNRKLQKNHLLQSMTLQMK